MTPSKSTPPAPTSPLESEGWRPEAGDTISGPVAAVSKAWSEWTNAFYPLVTIQTTDPGNGETKLVDVHAFHHTLQSRLMDIKPQVGDVLEIAYLGKRPTKDEKRTVAIYKVTAPGETGAEVWADLSGQAGRASRAAVTGDVPPDTEGLPGNDDIPF